ncbi:protein unc-80 homolog isoform X2 [Octopus sinensis]|uniref:Protein unc-80 homolog isoform X2 n=1 Tax=Octopus sinensis TaxID=2607531 RepID=A0A7E6EFZ6_9MOLL|nr:protein unc-80 homolog isoform X2 [Octopus sinensis]
MPKRKFGNGVDYDHSIPLPIQSFFWRQTSMFIRPKLVNIIETSCLSFERVVVQNILHGLSPSLCEAIHSVSRWKVIQTAFPHVLHACAALLAERKQRDAIAKFTNCETKLLYTLHWILLDAASECEDNWAEMNQGAPSGRTYMHALGTIQLFVYLLAPLVHTLSETDFQSLKLENGLRIWQPLIEHYLPDVPCFSSLVKPQRNILKAHRSNTKHNTNAANIYIGKGCSEQNLYHGVELCIDEKEDSNVFSGNEPTSPLAPLAHMSDICALSSSDSQSATVDVVCEYCNSVVPVRSSKNGTCKCRGKNSSIKFSFDSKLSVLPKVPETPPDKDYLNQKLTSADTTCSKSSSSTSPDVLSACYFDIAVLRCLFCLHWPEDGIYWALKYIHRRLLEICDEYVRMGHSERERSKSLPIPSIQVLQMYSAMPYPSMNVQDSVYSPCTPRRKSYNTSNQNLSSTNLSQAPTTHKEPPHKRIRVTELKQLFDSSRNKKYTTEPEENELHSLRSRRAEPSNISLKSLKADSSSSCTLSTLDTDSDFPRPNSAFANYLDVKKDSKSDDIFSDPARRKSMPSLHQSDKDSLAGTNQLSNQASPCSGRVDSMPVGLNLKSNQQPSQREHLLHPIITITEHSPCDATSLAAPSQSPNLSDRQRRGSNESRRQVQDFSSVTTLNMARSMTDSNIAYSTEDDIQEASGSVYYIQDNGQFNYGIILKAVHFVSMNEHSPRICEVLLNILNSLLDLDIIDMKRSESEASKSDSTGVIDENAKKSEDKKETNKNEETTYCIAMDSIVRIYKSLGCPQGCGDGVRGTSGENLRQRGQNCLQRLQRGNPSLFRKYLRDSVHRHSIQDSVDFMHSILGFCIESGSVVQSPTDSICTILQSWLDSECIEKLASGHKKCSSSESSALNFSNNFGHSIGGVGHRGVEGVIVANILKPLVSKCVDSIKELSSQENISLFCDVRQLISHVKEVHGGTLRRVALSGLLDSLERLRKKKTVEKEKENDRAIKGTPISTRHTTSGTSDSGDEKDWHKSSCVSVHEESAPVKNSRRSIFRKKVKKPLVTPYSTASDSEILEDTSFYKQGSRLSMSASEDDPPSGSNTPKRRFSRFQLDARASGSNDTTDHAENDMWFRREKKLVDQYVIKSGMMRFSFLLECCAPGSLPDPQLVAAMLTLEAPVIARATLLLECAHFIHRCNNGDWPNWMKLNLPTFRHSTAALQSRGQPSGYRRSLVFQRAAGKMFYQWAETLGSQLEYIMAKEYTDKLTVIDEVTDELRKRELRMEDENENFLDEATVNFTGAECPYALKMVACLVLLEITTFMRETYQYIPKSRMGKRDAVWERTASTTRRWSSGIGSPGHSEKSIESNIGDVPQTMQSGSTTVGSPTERKISFAVQAERSDSIHSSNTSLSVVEGTEERKGVPEVYSTLPFGDVELWRRLAQGRQKLLKHFRRSSGPGHNSSFRHNRSFRLKRQEGGSIKRFGSIRSRKISSQSIRSDKKFLEEEQMEGGDSQQATSDHEAQESHTDQDAYDEKNLGQNMPWIKIVVQLANLSNFICTHQNYCHPYCYERQRRSCSRLITAVNKIYESVKEVEVKKPHKVVDLSSTLQKDKLKRKESLFQQASPTRRRESTPLLEKIKSDVSLSKLKLSSPHWKKEEKPHKAKAEPLPIVKYITTQAHNLTQSPMAVVTKAAPILSENTFVDMMPVAWELILESDQELAASAATVFLLTSVKAPDKAQAMLVREMQHEDVNHRINSILRFGTLWQFRYQVWPRMEEGANNIFKVPPPNIDFTLPSPTIGLPSQTVIDPPWKPLFKAKIEEVTLNQEETKTLVTATTTRRKQQQEMILRALRAEEERKRIGRENFPLTTTPVLQLAAYEPALHHVSEDHEEVISLTSALAVQEEINMAARRVSLAPINRANVQSRSMSWRNGSIHWGRLTLEDLNHYQPSISPTPTLPLIGDEDRTEHMHHMQLLPSFFPSCMCVAILPILHLMDDFDVNNDGMSVADTARNVIWKCLVDDPALFLRHFLEKLTNKDRQEELIFLLRKLLLYFRDLPAQMAHSLFNYLIGYVIFYVRTPSEGGKECIAGALSLLWQIIPSVEEIYFKDLKQTLRKEQCDPFLLVSSNVPSAKKIIVHGPDLASIPSQFPIQEDTKFSQILTDSLDFFNIPEDQHNSYFIVDTKSNHMHNLNSYVRDFYFFHRNIYPQLSLVHMNPDAAFQSLQKQAFVLKFVEFGKVLFSNAVLQSTQSHQLQNHVSFLHEEFMKLPTFPRKALEAEFNLYCGNWGKELYGMDTLHKYSWVKLINTMFSSMSKTFNWSNDLPLFLNVLNGTIVLHCEDTAVLRNCLAILINTSKHFKHIFSTSGFLHIMPTILRVYSNNQPNTVLCKAIEFTCRQFYILHRKPFILQMFGSTAPILDMDSCVTRVFDCNKIQPECLFRIILDIGHSVNDNLDILDLVTGEKPLKALDFCYENDSGNFDMVDIVNMCVTVIAYSPDSFRSYQMLIILEVVVPRFLKHLKEGTTQKESLSAAQAEIQAITNIAVSIRALINSCEIFTRNMSIPQRHMEVVNASMKPMQNHTNFSTQTSGYYYDDKEESHTSRVGDDGRKKGYVPDDDVDAKQEFRKPRDTLLFISSEFFSNCHFRLRELRKKKADPSLRPADKPPELFDSKTHNRLAEIAHTLLKLAPYDPYSISCPGLQSYMVHVLPITDWSQEQIRPALILILRRLDRLFSKVSKKLLVRQGCHERQIDWEAAANLLKGVYLTLRKHSFIAHLSHLKTLINVLIGLILSGSTGSSQDHMVPTFYGSHKSDQSQALLPAPSIFCSAVIKLVAMQMQVLGEQFSLEQIFGGMSVFPSIECCLNMLVDFILPLCIRTGYGRRDSPRLLHADIRYALSVVLHALNPPIKHSSQSNTKTGSHHINITEQGQSDNFLPTEKYFVKPGCIELQEQTAYLGLQVLMVCFDNTLAAEWHHVAKYVMDISTKTRGSLSLWKFLDFIVTYRPSVFLLLQPFIQFKMMKVNCDTAEEYFLQQIIKDKLMGVHSVNHPKCKGNILIQLTIELRQIKEELANADFSSGTPAMLSDQSELSYNQATDQQQQINEITAEIVPPKFSLGSVGKHSSKGSTVFSQSSSSSSTPFKTATTINSSAGSGSPLISTSKKSTRRISAKDGSRILDKFERKNTIVDDPSPEPPETTSPKLQRQSTICFQVRQGSPSRTSQPAGIVFENECSESQVNGAVTGAMTDEEGSADVSSHDPAKHRLQRQDAKSRKTFKIKKKTKTTSMRHLISRRGLQDQGDGEIVTLHQGSPTHGPLSSAFGPDAQTLQLRRTGAGAPIAKSVEVIPEAVEVKQPRRKQRYIQRSKSHDDPSADIHAPAGTARGRIARQGARIVRSRSPSGSPVRHHYEHHHHQSTNVSPATSQTYMVTRCDSSDSINTNENSALLKDDEKNQAQAALCIYFDGSELDDSVEEETNVYKSKKNKKTKKKLPI